MADQTGTALSNVNDGTLFESGLHGGRMRVWSATEEVASGVGSGEQINGILMLPRQLRPYDIKVNNDALGTSVVLDLGDSNGTDGLIDGADVNATTEKTMRADGGTNGFTPVDDDGKELWELLGYSTLEDAPALIQVDAILSGANPGTGTLTITVYGVVD